MATKIAVMDKGVIQQFGTPDEIYDKPANLFVADFIGSPAHEHGRRRDRCDNGAIRAELPAPRSASTSRPTGGGTPPPTASR